jgi:hypothetical protein
MLNFGDLLRRIVLAACLVPIILYLEHGHISLPKFHVVVHFGFRVLPLRIYSFFCQVLYWSFYGILFVPSLIGRLRLRWHLTFDGWRMYIRYCIYEIRLFLRTQTDLVTSIIIFAVYVAVGVSLWYLWTQEESLGSIFSSWLSVCIKILRFIPERLGLLPSTSDVEEKYDVNNSYGDPKVLTTGLIKDLRGVGIKTGRKHLRTLLQVAMTKGKPVDDKLMTASMILHFCL